MSSAPKPTAAVSAETVELEPDAHKLRAIGRVKNARDSMVAAKTMGRVERIRVKSGDFVKKGQTLAQIDSVDARARLEQARGAYAQAQAARQIAVQMLERYETLSQKDAASRANYDKAVFDRQNAEGALTQAKGAVEQAEAYVKEATVIAPFEGRVIDTMIEEGEIASPGVPIVRMESGGALEFEATMNSQDILSVSVGMPVTVILDAKRREEREVKGRVTEIVPAADVITHTNVVRIGMDGADWVRSGMFGRARFDEVSAASPTMLVEQSRVVSRGQLDAVYVVDHASHVRLRLVRTGRQVGTRLEVLAGLSPGDRIVTSSLEGLIDGQPAEVRR